MKKSEIEVGARYWAKVNGRVVPVRVESIGLGGVGDRQRTTYSVVNENSGRRTTFRSAAKFIHPCPK